MRRVLRFRPEMLDRILAGVKTATVRPDGGSYADRLTLTDGLRSVEAEVLELQRISAREVLDYYEVEGFGDRTQFQEYLRRLYPRLRMEDRVTFIRFTLKNQQYQRGPDGPGL